MMRIWPTVLVLCLAACRSETERARERADAAARSCLETTQAAKLPLMEGPLGVMDETAPVLRLRPRGVELDTRAALASRAEFVDFFGKGKPPVEPQLLEGWKAVGEPGWYFFDKVADALDRYEQTRLEEVRLETSVVLDVDPDVLAVHVASVLNRVKHRALLAVRRRDGSVGLLAVAGRSRVDMQNERCTYSEQQKKLSCATARVRVHAGSAQLFAQRGLVAEECIDDAHVDRLRGPFVSTGASCEFPLSSTEDLAALAKAVREVGASEPGCRYVAIDVEPTTRWSDVTPVIGAIVASKGEPLAVALLGMEANRSECPATPLRPEPGAR